MMKKRIAALALACAMAATLPAMTVSAAGYASITAVKADMRNNDSDSYHSKDIVDWAFDYYTSNYNSMELKPSGVADVKVSVVSGSAKDNLVDNGVKPLLKEFVKKGNKSYRTGASADGTGLFDYRGQAGIAAIYYGSLNASQAGNVTFKLEDKVAFAPINNSGDDTYAIVLHYTGNAADEDGITAQYCKISSASKVTAHFNTYGPFAIIATNETSAQRLANAYSHSVGSDAANLTPAATVAAPVATTTQATAAPTATQATAAPVSSTATPAATTQATVAAPAATTTTQAAAAPSTVSTVSTTSQTMQTSTPATITPNNGPIMVVR